MEYFILSTPPSDRSVCKSHLLCRRSAIFTAACAMTMHRVITSALTWDSHQELTDIINGHRLEIHKTRPIIYGIEAMSHMADLCDQFSDVRQYLENFNNVYTQRYIGDNEIPSTYHDIFAEDLEWDAENDAIDDIFNDVMVGVKLDEPVVEPVTVVEAVVDAVKTDELSKQIANLQKQIVDLKKSGVKKSTQLSKIKKALSKELALCPICVEGIRSVSLICGHVLCEECVTSLVKCPFCTTKIDMREIRTVYL